MANFDIVNLTFSSMMTLLPEASLDWRHGILLGSTLMLRSWLSELESDAVTDVSQC